MDEIETTTLASGSEAPATQSGEDTKPSAANNYEGIFDSAKLETQQPDDDTELSEPTDEGEGSEEVPDPWAGYVDFVHVDGNTYKVPEALADGYYRNKDYTQGKQALADEKRAIAAQKEELTKAASISEKELNLKIELNGMVDQLQRYEQVDWDAFEQQEPLAAQSEFRKFQQLQQGFNRRYGELQNAQTERNQIVERHLANQIAATTEYAYKNLPGMSPELDKSITEFAIREIGFDPDRLKQSYNPQIYRTLYLAHIGHQTLKSQKAQAKTPPVKPPTQPLTVVSAKTGSSGRKSLSQLASDNFEEYRAARHAQMAKAK
jgi:hypothetical protein